MDVSKYSNYFLTNYTLIRCFHYWLFIWCIDSKYYIKQHNLTQTSSHNRVNEFRFRKMYVYLFKSSKKSILCALEHLFCFHRKKKRVGYLKKGIVLYWKPRGRLRNHIINSPTITLNKKVSTVIKLEFCFSMNRMKVCEIAFSLKT